VMTREPSLSDLDDLIRRFTNDEIAHAGDEMLDANSIISHANLDLGGSSLVSDILTTDTVVDGRLPDEPPTPRPPTQLGLGSRPQTPAKPGFDRFTVHEQLGWSVLATVHRATLAAKTTAREVALKRLAPQLADDPAFGERFLEQLARVSSIKHVNLAEIVDYGHREHVHYVAAELMTGVSLRKLLARGQPAPIAIVVGVVTQLLDGLVAAHRSAVLHGSVTSGNVFVEPDGVVKLTDLGVAHVLWGVAPHAIAKLGYMAPEVAMGGVLEPRADVFAVGVIAWELAAGRRLFDGRSPREILQQVRSLLVEPPSRYNARCDAKLDAIILSALLPYDRRARTAEAMRDALQPFTNQLEDHHDAIAAWVQRGDDEQAAGLDLDVHRFTLDQPLVTEPMANESALTSPRLETASDASLDESKVIIIERGD
jgi:serine/threonine protein kinase